MGAVSIPKRLWKQHSGKADHMQKLHNGEIDMIKDQSAREQRDGK